MFFRCDSKRCLGAQPMIATLDGYFGFPVIATEVAGSNLETFEWLIHALIPLYQCQPIRSRGAERGNFVNLNDYALAYRSEPFAANSFAKAPIFAEKLRRGETAGQEIARRKVMGCGKPDDDDGFTA